ncbi:MAG TPA: alpha/beta fold hydrolase [Acidimicrobiia bacterium]|jgi:polyhydroxyalkanoate synthase|nr:alpha/beta fold hydrolase [Acidimicrobiia bacterium]
MTTKPDPAASVEDQTKPTMTGAVPLVPLGRPQVAAAARLVAGGARHPVRLAGAGARLTGELASAALGMAKHEPAPGDRRFTDPAWAGNPIYKRVLQGYLGTTAVADDTVGRLGLDDKSEGRARFVVGQVVDALAPTNTLLGNPAALRKAAETKGASLAKGARALADDVLHNGAMPKTVDRRPFRLGETVATTPGAVVLRTEVLELIQYKPVTPTVGTVPVVFIPPEISRHYILDLSPGRSLIEHLVAQGQHVFTISWRNPTAEQRDWNLDTYVAASLEAVTTAALIAGSPDVHLVGACAGGITAAALAGHLAATGERRIRTITFLVTVLDTAAETMASLFLSEWSAALAVQGSKRTGVLKGRQLTRMFAWMRPNDLVWNYWVSNYLLGQDPPAFDVLAWNADMPNMTAGLHADFASLFLENPLPEPGKLTVLGTPIDLAKVDQDAYILAALTDHITPWEACYRTVGILGGNSRFVLSSSGHIQAIVNPPGNKKANYRAADDPGPDSAAFMAGAERTFASWWDEWSAWLTARDGETRRAPRALGDRAHPVLDPAPGRYAAT